MDLVKLLADAAPIITAGMSPAKSFEITTMLKRERSDLAHICVHVAAIMADGKLTTADIPDVVMFAVELFSFLVNLSPFAFTAKEIVDMADAAVLVIIAAPRFLLTDSEIKIARSVATACFILAQKVIVDSGACSNMCAWITSCCRSRPKPNMNDKTKSTPTA